MKSSKKTKVIALNPAQDKTLQSINPNNEPLTLEKLKSFEQFKNLSDEQAQDLLFSIQTLSAILYELLAAEETNSEINQPKIAA